MRILVVGAGATGGYFGARLAQAGRDVTFLVRPRRADQLAERGLRVRGPDGHDDRIDVNTVVKDRLADPFDIVLLAVKAYALDGAISDFTPAVGPATTIVPFLNGIGHIGRLTEAFGARRVYGGVCYVASTLTDDGDIVWLGGAQELRYGPLANGSGAGEHAAHVHDALAGAGFPAELSDTIETDMWEKWIFLASVTAVTCLARGTVGDVNAVEGGREFATAVTEEGNRVAVAAGFAPRAAATRRLLDTVTQPGAATTSSVFRDLRQGRPLENDAIITDLVRRARALDVATPLLDATDVNLAVYQRARSAT
ncbi:ketopantoate reductase [Asanoa ferruginea]|uniref:2-dehydropantoate 2-reductase n=1 Tax=Asanoa ferruginea TaxID=53367 RepID=A0A3D9ZQN0_9ACTN|nr:ketopantoate reductase family protein [Asanoa ferruginea]REF99666.1 ketopantoate reductase [Asanoa ferruginea]GIF52077.1 2-dehydropantoate 2-reductase [Asanoa ferruginea]